MRRALFVASSFALLGCREQPEAQEDEVGESVASELDSDSGDPSTDTTTGGGGDIAGLDLMIRLGGLWTGPATMTPLGSFEPMNMDFRAADTHVLFSRVDLDEQNSLRFAFSIETHGGEDVLIYRNGGYFLGTLRDSRTKLVEHAPIDADGRGSWRFCSVGANGCDYIDALFEFDGPDQLVFDVHVQGAQHVYWLAERAEIRDLPEPFPADSTSQGTGDAPFPSLPSLRTTVSWTDPLVEDADVWVFLSVSDCPLMGLCDFSRSLRASAPAGSTSVELLHEQIHPGPYRANAILDRDRNLETSMFPGTGDAVTLPNQAASVATTGESTLDLFTLVEL